MEGMLSHGLEGPVPPLHDYAGEQVAQPPGRVPKPASRQTRGVSDSNAIINVKTQETFQARPAPLCANACASLCVTPYPHN